MTPWSRRDWMARATCLGASALLPALRGAAAQPAPVTIAMVARRFTFEPREIVLRAGVPCVLEVQALDFVHGLNFPDFSLRFDLLPGLLTRVELPAQKAGTYDFLCDNFCGEGHEVMHGKLVVQD